MENIVKKVISKEKLTFDESFQLATLTSKRLRIPKRENWARNSIIHVLENWNNISSETYPIWIDLIESAGFYPYLEKEKNKLVLDSTDSIIRKEFFKSDNIPEVYFHEEQIILWKHLNSDKT